MGFFRRVTININKRTFFAHSPFLDKGIELLLNLKRGGASGNVLIDASPLYRSVRPDTVYSMQYTAYSIQYSFFLFGSGIGYNRALFKWGEHQEIDVGAPYIHTSVIRRKHAYPSYIHNAENMLTHHTTYYLVSYIQLPYTQKPAVGFISSSGSIRPFSIRNCSTTANDG